MKLIALASTLVLAGCISLQAQQSSCLLDSEGTQSLVNFATNVATSSSTAHAATRAAWGITTLPPSEVELITDSQICKTAGREYKTAAGLQGKAPKVYVVRLGTRYIVEDPLTKGGEFTVFVVFDLNFGVVAVEAG